MGRLETISRGVYRLADRPPLENPDIMILRRRIATRVVCLISALAFHALTTQIPHEVYLALPRDAKDPRLSLPYGPSASVENALPKASRSTAWRAPVSRPTKEIDLLGKLNGGTDAVMAAVKESCMQTVDPVGTTLDAETVTAKAIPEDAHYKGVRVRLQGKLA